MVTDLQDTGNCPVTGEALTLEDLVDIKANPAVKVRPIQGTSVPGMLTLFQDEWDAVVKECFDLRKQLLQTRGELSHTLYQHDAACRVIARVVRERDEARQALKDASAAGAFASAAATAPAAQPAAAAQGAQPMDADEDEGGFTEAIKQKMTERSTELSKGRKKREISASLATEEEVGKLAEKSSHTAHLANAILCVALHPADPNVTVSGGADGKVVLFDRAAGKATKKMAGHSKKVTRVAFHPTQPMCLSASADKTVRCWDAGSGKTTLTFKDHGGEVTGVSVHATGDYIVTASTDKTWALYDLTTGTRRCEVKDPGVTGGYSAATFHPDGLILGTGTQDSMVRVWDVKTQQNVVTFTGHPGGAVNSLNFSENGYYLVTSGADGCKTWDLRKVAKQGAQAVPVKHLCAGEEALDAVFDFSGVYVAVAGAGGAVRAFHTKSWNEVLSLEGAHASAVHGLAWGPDAKLLVSCGKDRNLKAFA
jgi:pre-mRNA-processing factor 19